MPRKSKSKTKSRQVSGKKGSPRAPIIPLPKPADASKSKLHPSGKPLPPPRKLRNPIPTPEQALELLRKYPAPREFWDDPVDPCEPENGDADVRS